MVQFSCSLVSNSLQPNGLQHTRLPCPSPSPGACSNSCPLSQWCHPTISSFVMTFSGSQSFPTSGTFPVNQLFTSGGQSVGASASVLPMHIQSWFSLGLTALISLLSKRLSRVFSSTKIWKNQTGLGDRRATKTIFAHKRVVTTHLSLYQWSFWNWILGLFSLPPPHILTSF